MRSSVNTPLLRVIYVSFAPFCCLGTCSRNVELVHFDRLGARRYRVREKVLR